MTVSNTKTKAIGVKSISTDRELCCCILVYLFTILMLSDVKTKNQYLDCLRELLFNKTAIALYPILVSVIPATSKDCAR